MAPELVQELPYNHSVDIWSYGIILYELFAGQPPFYTNNLYSLIKMIVKNQVKYPDKMSSEFKSFLKGLLVKDPSKRMRWPEIMEHPFLKSTNSDLDEEKRVRVKYNNWLRQVAQWNKDFSEFKSSKIDFFTSEVYNYDENGFTGYGPGRTAMRKKHKKTKKKGKNTEIESPEQAEKEMGKALDGKSSALRSYLDSLATFFDQFRKKSTHASSDKINRLFSIINKLYRKSPDLFESKSKSVAQIQMNIRKIVMNNKLSPHLKLFGWLVWLKISQIKEIDSEFVRSLVKTRGGKEKLNLKESLMFLEIMKEIYEKMQKNFTESQNMITDIVENKLINFAFSKDTKVISKEVLKSKKGIFYFIISGLEIEFGIRVINQII